MCYAKILRWQKGHLSNPLSPAVVAACVFAEKANPDDYFSSNFNLIKKSEFEKMCKEKNHFFGQPEALKVQFFTETGIDFNSLVQSELWDEILMFDSINDFLTAKKFKSKDEIKSLCKTIFNEYLDEPAFLDKKNIEKLYKRRGLMYSTQMENIGRNVDNLEKWSEGTANQLWFGKYALDCITEKFNELMKCEQTDELYKKSVITLKDAFRFSDLQIEMLKYFVCQSKEANCPASLNKALYFWSDKKGTGKTTVAATIVSILNGEKSHFNIRQYKSTLPQELGFSDFVAPLICSSRAVLLDEAMPKDSSKSYGSLKDRITSDGAKIRFVYKNQMDVEAKANYVFTSNDPLITFVQDKSERRFLEFEISKKYKNLTYKEIYDIFLQFIQQCKRSKEWQQWYDEMSDKTEVKGIESQNVEDFMSYFMTDSFFDEINMGACQISIGTFYYHVSKFEKVYNKQLVRECVVKLFGEPYRPSVWRKSDVLAGLNELRETDLPDGKQISVNNYYERELPF